MSLICLETPFLILFSAQDLKPKRPKFESRTKYLILTRLKANYLMSTSFDFPTWKR